MNRAASRIGGIDLDAQAAAREEARREGKSLGQWLHGAIADRAVADRTADSRYGDADPYGRDRVDAVATRHDPSAGHAAPPFVPTPRRPGRGGRGDVLRPRGQDGRQDGRHDGRDGAGRELFTRDALLEGRRRYRDEADGGRGWTDREPSSRRWSDAPEDGAALADALAKLERRSVHAERRTDEALAGFAHLIEASEEHRSRERDAVDALARQMASLQTSLSDRAAAADAPIRGALARLEARLDVIGKRTIIDGAIRQPLDQDEPLRRLEEKINTLLQATHGSPARPAAANPAAPRMGEGAAPGSSRQLPQAAAQAPSQALAQVPSEVSALAVEAAHVSHAAPVPRRRLGDAIAEIGRRQQSLECLQADGPVADAATAQEAVGLSAAPRRAAARDDSERLVPVGAGRLEQERLRQEISAITARMGASPAARRGEPSIAAPGPDHDRIDPVAIEPRDRPEAASAASLELIGQRLDAIAGRVQEVLERPTREPQLDALEAMVRDLAGRIDAAHVPTDDPRVLDQLQQRIEALTGRFERSEHELALLPTLAASVRKLFEQLDTVRTSVDTVATETARKAAHEVLRGFDERQRETAAAPPVAAEPGPDLVAAMQSMLGGVHDVLDRVVGRLAAVETDLADARARPAIAASAAAMPDAHGLVVPPQPVAETGAAAASQLPPGVERQPPAPPLTSSTGASIAGPSFRPATQRPAAPRMPGGDSVREPILPPAGRRLGGPAGTRFAADAEEDAQRLNFIAAARRAAKSAQLEAAQIDAARGDAASSDAATAKRGPGQGPAQGPGQGQTPGQLSGQGPAQLHGEMRAAAEARAGLLSKSRDYVAAHKRPLLMGLAAILVVAGTLALLQRTGLAGSDMIALAPQQSKISRAAAPAPARLALNEPLIEAPAPSTVEAAAPAPPSAGLAGLAAGSSATTPSRPAATNPAAPAPAAGSLTAAANDPSPTGSLTALPSFAAQAPTVSRAAPPPAGAPGLPPGLQAAAEAGSAPAQYDLGARYADGRGIAHDSKLAALWLARAADQNVAPAQYRLAMLYEKGIGIASDKSRARALYTAAAEAGNPRAMHNLAVMLADGDGHPDYAAAAGWFRKAASYGIHDSQYNLAILLARGLGTAQSLMQSYQWFSIAAMANDADAAHKRDEVGSKLSSNDLALAKALAAAYQPKSADPAAVEVAVPAGDGAAGPSHLNSVKSKVSSL